MAAILSCSARSSSPGRLLSTPPARAASLAGEVVGEVAVAVGVALPAASDFALGRLAETGGERNGGVLGLECGTLLGFFFGGDSPPRGLKLFG